jgi:competence protein ComEC
MRRLADWLARSFAAEQDGFFLWLPVLFGCGIALYFSLPTEPPAWPPVALGASCLLLTRVWRRGLASLAVGGAIAAVAAGFAAAKLSSDRASAPVLENAMRNAAVTGWVERVEPRAAGGERILVRVVAIEGLAAETTVRRLRVRVPSGEMPLRPGDAVALRANLLPPGLPALPGAYDFARAAWFQSLGAVGSARERPGPAVIEQPMPWDLAIWLPVERIRQVISRRVTAALPGESGAIAAALVTGERGGISETTNQSYRDSGIFHILSISGLHMTIFAGAVYISARFVLSLVPPLVLRRNIKKWAAVAGILGTLGYLSISGGSPPAIRSAVTVLIMFAAILLDRPALALRNVALAALVILIVAPVSLIDVGFQMSFAAVVALISGVEAWRVWQRARTPDDDLHARAGPLRQATTFLGAIVITTLIATAAVAPFAAFYFHKSTQYGILANLVAVPICNLVVMPAALATFLLIPFGLEGWPLAVMGLGIDAMSWVSDRVASLPGAVVLIPAIPPETFLSIVAGGLWLCLWRGTWRILGLVPMALGFVLAPWPSPPDVIVGAAGHLVAIRANDGKLAVFDRGRSTFELSRWLEHEADPRPAKSVGPGRTFVCDPTGCLASAGGISVALTHHPAALEEDCRRADVLIWMRAGTASCPPSMKVLVVTRHAVSANGTHVIRRSRVAGERPQIQTVADWRGNRPWSRRQKGTAYRGRPFSDGHARPAENRQ